MEVYKVLPLELSLTLPPSQHLKTQPFAFDHFCPDFDLLFVAGDYIDGNGTITHIFILEYPLTFHIIHKFGGGEGFILAYIFNNKK